MTFIVDGTNGLTFPNNTTQASAGQVLQVVNATYSTQVSTTLSSYTDTGLTASITPKFSTSKILIVASQAGCIKPTSDTSINLKLFRNSTEILLFGRYVGGNGTIVFTNNNISTSYLDSPSTTSSVTYKTQFNNDTPSGTVSVQFGSGTFPSSTITLMEIAA
jgi:hypothetical protein